MVGNLIIVSAPSGAGKTTLVGEAVKRDNQVRTSVSFTSRPPRADEEQGVHYHFVSRAEFEAMIANGDFLEWAEVHGNLYGTSRRAVEEARSAGFDVILTIDIQGAAQARNLFPDAIEVFLLPPSFDALIERLEGRGTDTANDRQLRLSNALHEIEQYVNFDYVVINDDLNRAIDELAAIIMAERCRLKRRNVIAARILQTFNQPYIKKEVCDG
ncbi:MAG TPA: guanylate kinase [Blastocatellia bacterium]|nr:guanylate kinase [Blastocatellia bacterium]